MGWGNVAIPELSCTWQRHSTQTPCPAMPQDPLWSFLCSHRAPSKAPHPQCPSVPAHREPPACDGGGSSLPGGSSDHRPLLLSPTPSDAHSMSWLLCTPHKSRQAPGGAGASPQARGGGATPRPQRCQDTGDTITQPGDTELLQLPAAIPELALPGAAALEEDWNVSPSLAHPTPAWGRGPGTIPARCSPVRGWLSLLGTRSRAPRGTAGHGEGSARAEAPAHAAAFPLKM